MRYLYAAMFAAILFVGCFASVSAQAAEQPDYSDGFSALHNALGSKMGLPTEEPRDVPGSVEQLTTEGLAYWLEDTNTPAFFNGVDRWALTDHGLVHWTGESIAPPLPQAPTIVEGNSDMAIASLSPRDYLYDVAPPRVAQDLDCIISHESRWDPFAKNPRSTATGLAQFLNTTWARVVPYSVTQGRPRTDPYASVDAAVWLYEHVGRTQWEVVTKHLC